MLGHRARHVIPVHNNHGLIESVQDIGINVEYFHDSSYRAILRQDNDKSAPTISVNTAQKSEMIDFSILHELGHLLLDNHWFPYQENDLGTSGIIDIEYFHAEGSLYHRKSEDFIDEFIATFLIPNDELQSLIDQKDCDYLDLLNEIAGCFRVPVQMAKIRLEIFLAVDG